MNHLDLDLSEEIRGVANGTLKQDRLRSECIIAFKVYDSVRIQDCLTPYEIGPARAVEDTCIGNEFIKEGEVIDPPSTAAAVTVDKMKIKKIIIVDKEPNPFKNGYWDIDLKYVFEYRVTFREADGTKIGTIKANSIYNKKVSLFGSTGTNLSIATDLLDDYNGGTTIDGEPYVLAEARAVALSAELCFQKRHGCHHEDLSPEPNQVLVTIGLFSIIKLYRIVNLTVESHGFCVPAEAAEIDPLNPCDFFDHLEFPLDVFCPPQKPEFFAGVTNTLPHNGGRHCGCGCGGKKDRDCDCDDHDHCHDHHEHCHDEVNYCCELNRQGRACGCHSRGHEHHSAQEYCCELNRQGRSCGCHKRHGGCR